MRKEIIFECAFYGRTVRKMGCMYYRSMDIQLEDPELFFASMYMCKLLVSRYISLQTAMELQQICLDSAELKNALNRGSIGEGVDAVTIMDYHANWTCGLSASLINNEKNTFRLGHIGFGWIFKNKKKIAFCCKMSVYGLCDTLLKVRKKDEVLERRLFALMDSLGRLKLGSDLYLGNYQECAGKLYEKALLV